MAPLLSRYVAVSVASILTDELPSSLDPILGVFTGVFAYYLWETNPRTAMPEDQRLTALVQWKREKWRQEREQKLMAGEQDVDLNAIRAAVEKEAGTTSQ